MAKNKQNFAENTDEDTVEVSTVEVKDGTHIADLIKKIEKDSVFSRVTTPEDIKNAAKHYVVLTIQAMKDDAKLYTVKPEDIVASSNITVLSHLKNFRDGLCSAKQFVNKLVDDMTLREQRDSMNRMADSLGMGGFGWQTPGMMGGMGIPGMDANKPMFKTPTMGMGRMNPATNGLFGAGAMVKMMSGENLDALDKLMILKTMAEHLEKESVGVELECAHDVSNSIYDAISNISLSKKSDIRAKNKEEKK